MAKIRTIKPQFWEDEKLATLSMECRLFYIGTWNIADDWGIFSANPIILKSKIFPYDNVKPDIIQKWLDALVEVRMLIPINYNNKNYYVIRTFRDHQKIDKRYGEPLIDYEIWANLVGWQEKQCDPDVDTSGQQRDHSVGTTGVHRDSDALGGGGSVCGSGKVNKSKYVEGNEEPVPNIHADLLKLFNEWWLNYDHSPYPDSCERCKAEMLP